MRKTLLFVVLMAGAAAAALPELRQAFRNPPEDAKVMVRWWWFGPAVTPAELEREMLLMKAAGLGGFEVQPVYPLALDGEKGLRNLPYLSKEFLEAVRFTAQTARKLGLRMDMTLGSGWPFGGPHISLEQAAGRLRFERGPARALKPGEQPIGQVGDFFFFAGHTGQMVKRAAVSSEGYVLDHYSRAALETHLKVAGEKLIEAAGPGGIHAMFCDSLEVYGSDWTPGLLEEFRKRRGYDLKPLLPALVSDIGEKTAAIRHDWGRTLTELAHEQFLAPLQEWCRRHKVLLRAQSYGYPPVALSSYTWVDLPEGEGAHWNAFSTSRWASSAAHLLGRAVTSSETWTWIHSPVFRATPLDFKAEADQHFLEGINQLIGHGWPYSPSVIGKPGWRFYAAGVMNDHNPWWGVMPDLMRYLQRVSFMLRQGEPVADIALYLPNDDAWASFKPGEVSLSRALGERLGPALIPRLLEAGYNFDFVDDALLGKRAYPILVLPKAERVPENVAAAGIRGEQENLAGELAKRRRPDVILTPPAPVVGFVHRTTPEAEIYFLANTGNARQILRADFRVTDRRAEWWDPFTGEVSAAQALERTREGTVVAVELEPYGSRLLVFGESLPRPLDLSRDWEVTFEGLAKTVRMEQLRSWTEDPETRFYSGLARYRKSVSAPAEFLRPGARVMLEFGQPTAVSPVPRARFQAWLEAPVREAAEVFVNGTRAGSVWRPPYEIDVTALLRAGQNRLEVVVSNLMINRLAGAPLPDYTALKAKYGDRFQPQDLENLKPLPAGLLGPVRLVSRPYTP